VSISVVGFISGCMSMSRVQDLAALMHLGLLVVTKFVHSVFKVNISYKLHVHEIKDNI
jgi:hypothetical protein